MALDANCLHAVPDCGGVCRPTAAELGFVGVWHFGPKPHGRCQVALGLQAQDVRNSSCHRVLKRPKAA